MIFRTLLLIGSVSSIATYMTRTLGPERAILAVVLSGAIVTYGGVSLFVAFFVLAPMCMVLFRQEGVPRRLMPAAIALGTSTFRTCTSAGRRRHRASGNTTIMRMRARAS